MHRSLMARLHSRDGGAAHPGAGQFERDARLIHRRARSEHVVNQKQASAWKGFACGEASLHILLAFRFAQYALIACCGRIERSYAWQPALVSKASG